MAKKDRSSIERVRRGITVVGAGNWGTSLAAGVVASGLALHEVVVRDAGSRRPRFRGAATVPLGRAKLDAEVLWLCVPDGEIAAVAAAIAAQRGEMRGQVVVHSSGALTVAALEAARRAGARVAGIAPVFSFPARIPAPLRGVLFVVEARQPLRRRLVALVRKLGGEPMPIASESKALYHAAATMASPLLVSAMQAAAATAELAGFRSRDSEALIRALAGSTLRNLLANGFERSFSGPFARGDAGTVELHLRVLLEHPTLHSVYLALARNAVETLPIRNGRELDRVLALPGSTRRVRN